MKPIDAKNENYELIIMDDFLCLFTNMRLDRKTIPEGMYCYDVRDADCDGSFAEVRDFVLVNHWGTIITKNEIPLDDSGSYYPKEDEPDYLWEYTFSLSEFEKLSNEEVDKIYNEAITKKLYKHESKDESVEKIKDLPVENIKSILKDVSNQTVEQCIKAIKSNEKEWDFVKDELKDEVRKQIEIELKQREPYLKMISDEIVLNSELETTYGNYCWDYEQLKKNYGINKVEFIKISELLLADSDNVLELNIIDDELSIIFNFSRCRYPDFDDDELNAAQEEVQSLYDELKCGYMYHIDSKNHQLIFINDELGVIDDVLSNMQASKLVNDRIYEKIDELLENKEKESVDKLISEAKDIQSVQGRDSDLIKDIHQNER